MTAGTDDARRDSVEHFKRKFARLTKLQRIKELVRYERARDGQLARPPNLPDAFFEDGAQALREMLLEEYDNERSLDRILAIARKHPSTPFVP